MFVAESKSTNDSTSFSISIKIMPIIIISTYNPLIVHHYITKRKKGQENLSKISIYDLVIFTWLYIQLGWAYQFNNNNKYQIITECERISTYLWCVNLWPQIHIQTKRNETSNCARNILLFHNCKLQTNNDNK